MNEQQYRQLAQIIDQLADLASSAAEVPGWQGNTLHCLLYGAHKLALAALNLKAGVTSPSHIGYIREKVNQASENIGYANERIDKEFPVHTSDVKTVWGAEVEIVGADQDEHGYWWCEIKYIDRPGRRTCRLHELTHPQGLNGLLAICEKVKV